MSGQTNEHLNTEIEVHEQKSEFKSSQNTNTNKKRSRNEKLNPKHRYHHDIAHEFFAHNKAGHKSRDPKKRVVFFDGKLKRISNIDTQNEEFQTKFHFYLTWLATEEEKQSYDNFEKEKKQHLEENIKKNTIFANKKDEIEWIPEWTPLFSFLNQVGGDKAIRTSKFGMKHGSKYKRAKNHINAPNSCHDVYENASWDIDKDALGFDPRKGWWIRAKYDCDMTFAETMELESYPFDCQDFTIHLQFDPAIECCDVLPFPRHGDYFSFFSDWSLLNEWELYKIFLEFDRSNDESSRTGKVRAVVRIHIKARRKWTSKAQHFIVTFCMFLVGLATFFIPPAEISGRLEYSITLLLSDIAVLQLLSDQLPNISYWTILDYYMYTCFIFLVSITIWSCLVTEIYKSRKNRNRADNIVLILSLVFFVLIQFFFFFVIKFSKNREHSKLHMNQEELDHYFKQNLQKCKICSSYTQPKIRRNIWNFNKHIDLDNKKKTHNGIIISKSTIEPEKDDRSCC